jgi:hypothetical protein
MWCEIAAWNRRADNELKSLHELMAQKLAACDVAAMSDTPETHTAAIIQNDSPFWSPAYESVMRRTSECIKLRRASDLLREAGQHLYEMLKHAAIYIPENRPVCLLGAATVMADWENLITPPGEKADET